MKRTPYIFRTIELDDINIYPGETFTVWMNKSGRCQERESVQVELRVTNDGTPELFFDGNAANKKPWSSWTVLKEKP